MPEISAHVAVSPLARRIASPKGIRAPLALSATEDTDQVRAALDPGDLLERGVEIAQAGPA
ncbi:hypothetical protein [Streptomyces glebosus]|uniref:hypothetical protein n=1 Tax=Streptomyces glebosus TaxID=249580 RepID=UPI00167EA73B|nr:hypothetical protein [Streptomyces glebosus]